MADLTPITREEMFYQGIIDAAGGGSAPTPTPTLITKNITENGTYSATDDNADGYSSVTVNVVNENNAKFVATSAGFNISSNIYSIDIPNRVTSIGNNAFYNCEALKDVIIPSSVTSIGTNAFSGCDNLDTITVHRAEGSISGAPWGAPNTTQIIWDGE